MASEEKIIKAGQLTLPRILFLVACGIILTIIVHYGQLKIGYLLVTLSLCILLIMVAMDVGIELDKYDPTKVADRPEQQPVAPTPTPAAAPQIKPKRSKRPPRRRR
jgi:hypothetical protein